jgi:hypothetical protein
MPSSKLSFHLKLKELPFATIVKDLSRRWHTLASNPDFNTSISP